MNSTLESMQIPVISTEHLTKEVADALTAQGDSNPWVICAPYEYGYFLWVSHDNDDEVGMPQCLRDIRDALDAGGTGVWVRLDSDANPIQNAPVYQW
jgi:hypothetical protein